MAETNEEQSKTTLPPNKFVFSVKIGNDEIMFNEITGLSSDSQVLNYRAGKNPEFSTAKMPGIKKYGNITFKRGICKDSKALMSMINVGKLDTIKRNSVNINLLDENNNVAKSWTLTNAFPCKITAPDLKADGTDVAIESLELAHEGIVVNK